MPDFLPATGLMGRAHGRPMSYHLQIAESGEDICTRTRTGKKGILSLSVRTVGD